MNTFEILRACGLECVTAVDNTVKVTHIDMTFTKLYPRNKLTVKGVINDLTLFMYDEGCRDEREARFY